MQHCPAEVKEDFKRKVIVNKKEKWRGPGRNGEHIPDRGKSFQGRDVWANAKCYNKTSAHCWLRRKLLEQSAGGKTEKEEKSSVNYKICDKDKEEPWKNFNDMITFVMSLGKDAVCKKCKWFLRKLSKVWT